MLTHRSSDDGKENTYGHTYPPTDLRWSLVVRFHCCTGFTEIEDGFDEDGTHELAMIRILALDRMWGGGDVRDITKHFEQSS